MCAVEVLPFMLLLLLVVVWVLLRCSAVLPPV